MMPIVRSHRRSMRVNAAILAVLATAVSAGQPTGETAAAVAHVFKAANLFPKSNRITDTTAYLSSADKTGGVISSANIESSSPSGVTVKIYRTKAERKQARLRMVKECPGCNAISACGAMLVYTPFTKAADINKILLLHSLQHVDVLEKHYRCR